MNGFSTMKFYFLLPVLVASLGGAVLVYGYWERDQVLGELTQLFQGHVESVASLVKEGAREAATATSLIYQLTEEHLSTTAYLLKPTHESSRIDGDSRLRDPWRVRLRFDSAGDVTGDFGPVPQDKHAEFIKYIQQAEPGVLIDDGVVRDCGLHCLSRRIAEGLVVICGDAERLNRLRREIGIGPLLKGVVQRDVLYVAIQDQSGILAAAPSIEHISSWSDDPELERVLSADKKMRLRLEEQPAIFEGLIPFEMADGTLALLRVGVDASILLKVRASSQKRYLTVVALVCGIVLMTILLTWIFYRFRLSQQASERTIVEQRQQREHWESIGQMASTVAHEIRNPLNTLGMITQRLPREFSVPEEQKEEFNDLLGLLQSESERVNRVITEFLNLGRPVVLNKTRVNLAEAMRDALLAVQIRAENEGLFLKIDNRCDRTVELDLDRFQQILGNLVGNALDAIAKDGRITVTSQCDNEQVVIAISDNGPGIEREAIEHVLKPFVSFKSKGTGLGLPLVKRLVEAHGGRFELVSNPSQGTVARFTIPIQQNQNKRKQP